MLYNVFKVKNMPNKNPVKILEVMRLLEERSDDDHPISVNEIIAHLETKGINSERKSIYTYIQQLEAFGLDIITTKDVSNRYHIGERLFQVPELKLLVDAVHFSKFITPEKSKELIEKLKKLSSIHQADQLQRDAFTVDRLKTKNNSIYINVDAIHEAILNKKRIKFKYFEYDIHRQMVYRKNGDFYTLIPEFLCWDDEKYYAIMYHEQHQDHVIFRVDKMREVTVLDSTHSKERKLEDFDQYCMRIFDMFQGHLEKVKIQFDFDLLNVVYDQFGIDVKILEHTEKMLIIEEEVIVSQTFLSWLFQFGSKVRILSPEAVVEHAKTMLKDSLKGYDPS